MIVVLLVYGFLRFLAFIFVVAIALWVALFVALAWLLVVLFSFMYGVGKEVCRHAQAAH